MRLSASAEKKKRRKNEKVFTRWVLCVQRSVAGFETRWRPDGAVGSILLFGETEKNVPPKRDSNQYFPDRTKVVVETLVSAGTN